MQSPPLQPPFLQAVLEGEAPPHLDPSIASLSAPVCEETSTDPVAAEKTTPQRVLEEIQQSLKVDRHWNAALEDDAGVRVSLFSRDSARVTQRTMRFKFTGEVQIYVHGHEFSHSFSTVKLTAASTNQFVHEVQAIVKEIRLKEICLGVHDPKYKVWWKRYLDKCHIDNNNFRETRYKATLRANDCKYLRHLPKKFCSSCYKMVRNLKQRKSPAKADSQKKTPNKLKANKYLSSAEKDARFKRKSMEIRNLQRKIARLKGKLDALIDKEGRTIDSKLGDSLGKTLKRGLRDLKDKD